MGWGGVSEDIQGNLLDDAYFYKLLLLTASGDK